MILKPHEIMPVDLSTMYNHFSTLLYDSSAQPLQFENNRHEANQDCNDLNKEISILEIENVINNLSNGKSAGIDGIGAEFYKHTITDILPIFHKLFNNILITGVFPKSWTQSILCPIFKSGSKNNPSNYRGILITTTIYKIFSSIINNRLFVNDT